MKDRISRVIAHSGKTKTAFAKEINVSAAFVSQICSGAAKPSDRTIADICRIFGVDRIWLETGVGEPFRESSPEEETQKALMQALGGSDESKARLIRAVANLPDELAEKAVEIVLKLAEDLKAE